MTPQTRSALYVAAGVAIAALLLYGLGRHDARVSLEQAQHQLAVNRFLHDVGAYKARHAALLASRDSARAVADSAEGVARARGALLDSIRAAGRVATARTQTDPLDSILRPLPLRPIGPNLYGTDSVGVRAIALVYAERDDLREQVTTLADQLAAQQMATAALRAAERAASDADTLAAGRADAGTGLVQEGQKVNACRILWVFSCPTRTTAYALGVGSGAAAVLAVMLLTQH